MTDAQTTIGVVAESGTDERRVALQPPDGGPFELVIQSVY